MKRTVAFKKRVSERKESVESIRERREAERKQQQTSKQCSRLQCQAQCLLSCLRLLFVFASRMLSSIQCFRSIFFSGSIPTSQQRSSNIIPLLTPLLLPLQALPFFLKSSFRKTSKGCILATRLLLPHPLRPKLCFLLPSQISKALSSLTKAGFLNTVLLSLFYYYYLFVPSTSKGQRQSLPTSAWKT